MILRFRGALNVGVMLVLCLVTLLPFYMMFIMGTYVSEDLFKGVVMLPGDYLAENVRTILSSNFVRFYWNSFYISFVSTALCVLVSALTGFAFAKYRFRGKNFLYFFILATMMIPGQLGLVGYVIEMRQFGLSNSHLALIIPWISSAFGVFWMTLSIRSSVSNEIIESARIDGCHDVTIFGRIVLPMIVPAIVTLSLLTFLWSWNNYVLPLILVNHPDRYTVPLGIATLSGIYRTDYAAQILGLAIGTLPILFLYAFGSKHFTQGLMAGSVKG